MPRSLSGIGPPEPHPLNADWQNASLNQPLLHQDDDSDYEAGSDETLEDPQTKKKELIRTIAFVSAVFNALCAGNITAFSLYGHFLLTRLHYTQLQVNIIAAMAGLVMYLTSPLFGYLCDRIKPSLVSSLAAVFFGLGYLLAAYTYRSGPPAEAGGNGWPFGVMAFAFGLVGVGTGCMYFSSVTTCAKNFANSKSKGFILAIPIAAYGLSGMWQSLLVKFFVYRGDDGFAHGTGVELKYGDVDVFHYFIFLAILLFAAGTVGTFTLRVVDEDKLIDAEVEALERSGLLNERTASFLARDSHYGTIHSQVDDDSMERGTGYRSAEKDKKSWLLNQETKLFIKDKTMWLLAAGFFLVSGPGEAFINNVGTVTLALTPSSSTPNSPPPAGLPSTHVTTIALTSTIARLLTGSLSDRYALRSLQDQVLTKNRLSFSRLFFLIPSALLLSFGYLFLSTPAPNIFPQLFHITTGLVGFGYGAAFSLVPIIISIVWGVENFGTNWAVVAVAQAPGGIIWGALYSAEYDAHAGLNGQCFGWECYGYWALGSANGTCQCNWCRKFHGCLVAQLLTIPKASLETPLDSQSTYKAYSVNPGGRRIFCSTCGSSIAFEMIESASMEIAVGTLDESVLCGARVGGDKQTIWGNWVGREKKDVRAGRAIGRELCETDRHFYMENAIPGVTDNLKGKLRLQHGKQAFEGGLEELEKKIEAE
ncbi:putative monocarboxylate transporter mch1 [Myotisia sp. PD_48]|nr:putative monocarboxylate transporter mch1 [Myotisia sp. PD_48]